METKMVSIAISPVINYIAYIIYGRWRRQR